MPGGGTALLRCLPALEALKCDTPDRQMGVEIVKKALRTPATQIAANGGLESSVIVNKIIESKERDFGYDAANDKFVDMIKLVSLIRLKSYERR